MSAKGKRYDNAAMENWNYSLKVEAIPSERSAKHEQAKANVFDSSRFTTKVRAVPCCLDGCPKFRGKIMGSR